MPVNISIKNVPDDIAEKLRLRARKNHRSLQGELMAILENVVAVERSITPVELFEFVNVLEIDTSAESADIIRRDRDAR